MQNPVPQNAPPRLLVPKAPVIIMDGHVLFCLTLDGELTKITPDDARMTIRQHMPIVCHAANLAKHLKIAPFPAYDVLELFAFIHPGRFTVPTPRGIARALSLLEPLTADDQCLSLRDSIRHLLADLMSPQKEEKSDPAALAAMMGLMTSPDEAAQAEGKAGWPWTEAVLAALGRAQSPPSRGEIKAALRIWEKLPEWSVHAPEPPPSHHGVSGDEAAERLHDLLARQKKEDRPQQREYTRALTSAFLPRNDADTTHAVMAEAGTGTGKTLGYLAPATVWSEKNGAPVWISTYTRNLQRQVETELSRLYADPVEKSRKVVTRKGRENYLCLLNLEDAAQSFTTLTTEQSAVALGLMTRWAAVTEDGDLMGRDFPGWLAGLIGWNRVYGLADRRGECIYSACPHFNKCFIEKSVRKARRADIVIANHALVMHQTAVSGADDVLPSRYVFDEGHHLFEAADSAFSAHLNGTETAELRRWLLGTENTQKSRARGIKKRLEELIAGDDGAARDVEDLLEAARSLPGPQWRQRLAEKNPKGVTEQFLTICRQQVLARNSDNSSAYSIEAELLPPLPGLFEAAYALSLRLNDIRKPMMSLIHRLKKMLENDAETLDTAARERIQFTISSLTRRAENEVGSWITMLEAVKNTPDSAVVDWLEITRIDGQETDCGFYRYTLDPAAVFASQIKPHAHGMVITSATLRDTTLDDSEGWQSPLSRTGMKQLTDYPHKFHVASPFDYPAQTRIFVINDVKKDSLEETAGAFKALFTASGGGALGIFTSIQRLRAVHERVMPALEKTGLHLYAQHIDPLDTGTLIDIFREEENACLFGTDATRDGIDVPGRSLRMVVYDRVPWPRPTILHKARRVHFGKTYDDMLTRFKLKQAYGRLIRNETDKGVFVMLDSALPTRLTQAFPDGVEIERLGLAEALVKIKELLS